MWARQFKKVINRQCEWMCTKSKLQRHYHLSGRVNLRRIKHGGYKTKRKCLVACRKKLEVMSFVPYWERRRHRRR